MIYGQQDLFQRLKATLPTKWFGERTPTLDAILNALAAGWVGVFNFLTFVGAQSRVLTAVDDWLDLASADYFGDRLPRRPQEPDGSFRQRVRAELVRDRCTRAAVSSVLLDLTGATPSIFEPTNPQDTGCYGAISSATFWGLGYGAAGGWGSLALPFQAFVTASRPAVPGLAGINGWGGDVGGFGIGCAAYIPSTATMSYASDTEIYNAVARVAPAGAIVWLALNH